MTIGKDRGVKDTYVGVRTRVTGGTSRPRWRVRGKSGENRVSWSGKSDETVTGTGATRVPDLREV